MVNGPWHAWMPLLITLLIQALVTMALLTLPVMAPVVAKANGISPTLVGVYVSLSYIGAILASLMAGASVLRFGPIRVSQLGLLICAVGLALCAVPWWPVMVVGAVCVGLGYGPMTPASSHLLARSTPAHQMSLVFSLKQTGVPLGGMLAGAVVPSLLLWVDWQASLWIVAVLCVACALLSQTQRQDLDSDRQPEKELRWGNILQPFRLFLMFCNEEECQLDLKSYHDTQKDKVREIVASCDTHQDIQHHSLNLAFLKTDKL